MRIENQRIVELEATVRSLSTISQSAEANTSQGFAAGYQSPMVFLEGEEDDVDTVEVIVPVVDTVEVIVPAPPEPVDFNQSLASQAVPVEQQRSDTQFVAARSASIDRTSANNGNGVPRQAPVQAPGETPKAEPAASAAVRVEPPIERAQSPLSPAALAAGTAAAAAIWTRDKDRPTVSPYVQEQPVAEPLVSETPVSETIVYGVPAEQRTEEPIAQEYIPGLVGDLAPSKQTNYVDTTAEIQPSPQSTAQATAQAPNDAAVGAHAEATSQVLTQPAAQVGEGQPVLVQPVPPQAEPAQSGRQNPDEDSGLSPAGVAVLVSALASKLAGEEQRPSEVPQQQPSQPQDLQAEPSAGVPQAKTNDAQTVPESAPAAIVMPVVYDVPETPTDPQAVTQDAPQDSQGTVTSLDSAQNTDPAAQPRSGITAVEAQDDGAATAGPGPGPAEEFTGDPAAVAADLGRAPQYVTAQGQDSPLPLSAILPRAAKPAPLSKSGQASRPEAAQASALTASGIEPEIEQVSNQLDDLIQSINGLIERTQPLLDQPPSQGQALSADPPAAPAPVSDISDYNPGDETGNDEDAGSDVTGPYSAQNLSRMEYGLVQLMQAARRLGRDVRSAF
jgi:hypothetical protein